MIKMYIDNEEVVCNKEFTIKEEMLSTSSTILNNCYPKSWEQDHDYVSRFYYPKDYSKCKIIDSNTIEFEILGETIQNGTPTFQNTIPVINKTGTITEEINNKNYTFDLGDLELCKIGNYADKIYKIKGINLFDKNSINILNAYFEYSGDTIKGNNNNRVFYIPCNPNTTYAITDGISSLSNHLLQAGTTNELPTIGSTVYNFQNLVSNPIYSTNANAKYLVFRIRAGDDVSTYWEWLQIQKGNQKTPYEPYGNPGDWFIEKRISKYTFNGTESWYISNNAIKLANLNSSLGYSVSNSNYGSTNTLGIFSNYGITEKAGSIYSDATTNKIGLSSSLQSWGGTSDAIYASKSNYTVDDFKNLLIQNNLICYYVSENPVYIKIIDEKLIGQLNKVNNNLLFAGMVKNSGDISLNPREPKYCSLEILDFKDFLSTGDMLDFVISNKTITEAISMVVDAINQYGFVLGNVNINNSEEIIGAYSTLNKSAYDVFQYLADISGSRWTTRMIDENTVAIDFYDPQLMPSGIDIEYTKEWWCTNKVLDLTFNYGTRDYRNKQVMLSDEVYGGVDYDETIIADGYNTNYITTTNIAEIKAISVNGTPMTFATTYDKELGVEADFYYTFGNNTIETNETHLAGTVINIGYTPLVKGREVVSNEDEINRVSNNTGRKGVIARYENRNDVLSSNELKMIGETYIKYKGSAEVIITLKTRTDIYNVGQSVYFDAPIEELNTDYMVKKKSIEIIATTGDVFYTYELSSSFNSEAAINWFDNQRNKATGNIAEGESITRNIDIESKATIVFSNATATEITITDTNVLNAPLNAPFTQ